MKGRAKRAARFTRGQRYERQIRHWTTWCQEHGKQLWPTKAAAKAGIRAWPDPSGVREYRCTTRQGWHVGHMPHDVRKGHITMREVRNTSGARRA